MFAVCMYCEMGGRSGYCKRDRQRDSSEAALPPPVGAKIHKSSLSGMGTTVGSSRDGIG